MSGYHGRRLPAGPLLEVCDSSSFPSGSASSQIFFRARRTGWLTAAAADRLAVSINKHPAEIWPEWFDEIDETDADVTEVAS